MVANFSRKGNSEYYDQQLLFKALGVIFLVIVIVLFIADFKMYRKKKELDREVSAYEQKIAELKKSSQTLREEINNSNNIDYLEKLGYEQFAQTRPGETEYMFIDSQIENEVIPADDLENSWKKKNWFSWIGQSWQWIKDKF